MGGTVQPKPQPHPAAPGVSNSGSKMVPDNPPSIGYSAIEGMPPGLNGPNVIVVDTSSLKTREEEEKEKKGKKKKKNKNKTDADPLAKSASVGVMPSYMSPVIPRSATSGQASATSGLQTATSGGSSNPSTNSNSDSNAANSLKSGPQVLIKNVNGKVTITPVPGTGATPLALSEQILHKNSSSKVPPQQQQQKNQPQTAHSQTQPQINGVKKSPPQMRQVLENTAASAVQKSHSVPNVNGHMQQQQQQNQGRQNNCKNNGNIEHDLHDQGKKGLLSFNSADGDDPDKVFAPSNDIDMDKADDSDRVVEQYKRFLAGFPSPSPDKPRVRPKVELDLKNIFKKKPAVFNSNGNVSSPGVETAPNTTSS